MPDLHTAGQIFLRVHTWEFPTDLSSASGLTHVCLDFVSLSLPVGISVFLLVPKGLELIAHH